MDPSPALDTAAQAATQARQPLIAAHGLVKAFGGIRAVDGMALSLQPGEMIGLIGPNGAGKTTLFNLLAGALKPDAGSILVSGHDLTRAGPERRIGARLGRTFQIPRPFGEMTVLENLLTGAQGQAGERAFLTLLRPGLVAAQERRLIDKAHALLDFVTLSPLAQKPARVLSGGQRKLLELARVLMADPQALLLDEPAAGVNPSLLELIIERVQRLNADGMAVLLIEHNMEMVSRLCSRVIVMAGGRLLTEGTPAAVARDTAVVDAYLGGAA